MGARKKKTPSPAPVEVPSHCAAVDSILQDIEQDVEHRAQSILSLAAIATAAIQNQFKVQLVKLPKKVRSMSLDLFKKEFGGDIAAAALQDLDKRLAFGRQGALCPPNTVLRVMRQHALPAETPAAGHTTRKRKAAEGAEGMAVGDPSVAAHERVPKVGEIAYSAHGSPLGKFEANPSTKQAVLNTVLRGGATLQTPLPGAFGGIGGAVATVIRREKPGSKRGLADAIVVTTRDGSQIAVDLEGGLAAVPAKQRKEVQSQLEALRRLAESALGVTIRHK